MLKRKDHKTKEYVWFLLSYIYFILILCLQNKLYNLGNGIKIIMSLC